MARERTQKRWLARLDTPDAACALVALVVGLFLFQLLHRTWRPAEFIFAGGAVDQTQVPVEIPKRNGSPGYDGQFYFRLALKPYTHARTEYGIELDAPARRQQRIFYPLLAWLLAFGQPLLLPALLVFINGCALCALAWLGGAYFQTHGRHALWGALLSLYPGLLQTLRADLPEALEVALIVASLLLLSRGRTAAATLALVLAVLTCETALVVALAAFAAAALARRKPVGNDNANAARGEDARSDVASHSNDVAAHCGDEARHVKWFYWAAPLSVFAGWQLVLYRVWVEWPVWATLKEYGLPLRGLGTLVGALVAGTAQAPRRTLIELVALAACAALAASLWRATAAPAHVRLAWAAYAALALLLGAAAWSLDWNFLRALSEFYALGVIVVVRGRGRARAALLACGVTLMWCLQAYRLLKHIF
ncbi:MAG TPA: hypothetical protein VF546_16290 [Pyrinomonadaceae bacterium]|jgi:hypothetical protein